MDQTWIVLPVGSQGRMINYVIGDRGGQSEDKSPQRLDLQEASLSNNGFTTADIMN